MTSIHFFWTSGGSGAEPEMQKRTDVRLYFFTFL